MATHIYNLGKRKVEYDTTVSSTFNWCVYDPEDGNLYCKSEDDAVDIAEYIIKELYLHEDEWNEDVELITVSEVKFYCKEIAPQFPVGDIDDNGEDEEGTYWGNAEYRTDFGMVELHKENE